MTVYKTCARCLRDFAVAECCASHKIFCLACSISFRSSNPGCVDLRELLCYRPLPEHGHYLNSLGESWPKLQEWTVEVSRPSWRIQ